MEAFASSHIARFCRGRDGMSVHDSHNNGLDASSPERSERECGKESRRTFSAHSLWNREKSRHISLKSPTFCRWKRSRSPWIVDEAKRRSPVRALMAPSSYREGGISGRESRKKGGEKGEGRKRRRGRRR
jgi:ribonuclease I